jgi:hypothetical protein
MGKILPHELELFMLGALRCVCMMLPLARLQLDCLTVYVYVTLPAGQVFISLALSVYF